MNYFEKHLANFQSVLSSRNVDAILLANFGAFLPVRHNYNFTYVSDLLGLFPWCFLVFTEDECGVWVSAEDAERAKAQTWIDRVEPMQSRRGPFLHAPEEFAYFVIEGIRSLTGLDAVKVGVDCGHLSSSVVSALVGLGCQVEDVSLDLEMSRKVLDDRELDLLRKAGEIVDSGVEKVMDAVCEGITERELSILAESEMRMQGADCVWHPSVISSGPEAEQWPNSPADREIRSGDLLWMDLTPVYRGYATDIARSFVYGKASQEQLDVFKLAEETLAAAVSTLGNGVTVREVMDAAAGVVKGSRYEPFCVGTGHMIGLFPSFYPVFLVPIAKRETLPQGTLDLQFAEGMTVAIEVIFTVPGLGGMHLEDDYIITVDRPERLTHAPTVATVE